MKRIKKDNTEVGIYFAMIFIIIGFLTSVVWTSIQLDTCSSYQRDLVVVDKIENILTLQDINGELWEYDDTKDCYHVADTCVGYFNDNNTSDTIYDDTIIKLKKIICIH